MPENPPQPRIISSAKDVAEKILRSQGEGSLGKVLFLIGAGCSVTAGVPGAAAMAKKMVKEIARQFGLGSWTDDAAGAYRALVSNGSLTDAGNGLALSGQTEDRIDWYRVYDEMFERHYCTRDDIRDLFGKIVEDTKGAINWAHLCLGELAARGFISTVLTTNFDQLVLSGMVRAGVLPVTCDGIESLNRIAASPRHVQLIELHGSRHTYILRNRPDDVKQYEENPVAGGAIQGLIQNAVTFVVVGYAGREKGVMGLLIRAAQVFDDKNLFWVQRSPDPRAISPQAAAFLATTRNGGLLLDQDADSFFLELCRALGVGAPSALSDPLKAFKKTIEDVGASSAIHADILNEIAAAKAQLDVAMQVLQKSGEKKSDVDKIRELRLAGKNKEAYLLAEKALKR